MMAQMHLHELLKEDQEPFHLKNYIADRRCQLKRPSPKTTLQLKKRKPIIENNHNRPISRTSLCRQACFFSFHDSPDVRKSPFVDFPSPAKSPCKSPNTVFLHIPARTATLLLDAAMRIQKQTSSSKPKTQIKNVGFGLFGSILKKLKDRNRNKKREISEGVRVSVKGRSVSREKFLREGKKVVEDVMGVDDKIAYEMGFSCSCNHSRLSSAGWSETNEEKSLDLETSSSCRSVDSEEIEFEAREVETGGFDSCEKRFCSSPLSPFRFALHKSPSPGRRTPEFLSPATSPSRHKEEEKEKYEVESLQNVEPEDEEEKEQCSPVSVLDPRFEDDEDDGHEGGDEEEEYDLECSYAIVQRAKQQLLHKLRRFEKLAELDPIEVEKRMLEEDDDDNEDLEEEEECEGDGSLLLYKEKSVDEFVKEVFSQLGLCHLRRIPADVKRLVSDLVSEENGENSGSDDVEVVAKRVCKRLDSWKEVESNTIDMMVELDFRRELDGWKRNQEQVGDMAMELELAIFKVLVEELSEELVCSTGL